MSLKWTEYQGLRVSGKEKTNVAWWVNDKIKLNKFLTDNRIPTPKIFEVWSMPEDIQLNNVEYDNFVLKPSNMHSSAGVMVLKRLDEDNFFDSLNNRYLTKEQIISEQVKVHDRCKFKGSYKIFAEEKIISPNQNFEVPLDYKIFCFYGRPMLVSQYDRNPTPKQAAWFDGEFSPLDLESCIISDWKMIELGDNVLPIAYKEMLDIAAKTSLLVKSPFMRVDMYSSLRGPLVGELTPAPGGPYYGNMYKFTDKFDAEMGEAWQDAVKRMD